MAYGLIRDACKDRNRDALDKLITSRAVALGVTLVNNSGSCWLLIQPPRVGTKEVGLVEYDFDGAEGAVRFLTPVGAQHLDALDALCESLADCQTNRSACPINLNPAVTLPL